MLFTSYEFLVFLAAVFLLYYLLPRRTQWVTLLCASYLFYALAGVKYLAFIAFTTVSSFAVARLMGKVSEREKKYLADMADSLSKDEKKAYKSAQKKKRFSILCVGLILNFGVLAVLKYTAFAVVNLNSWLHAFGADLTLTIPSLLLPLGISFYTFQTMGYLIDVYRAKAEPQRNIFKFALFVADE